MNRRSFLGRVLAVAIAPSQLGRLTAEGVLEDAVPAVASEAALVASGGLVAPITPYYMGPLLALENHPVRDAFMRVSL